MTSKFFKTFKNAFKKTLIEIDQFQAAAGGRAGLPNQQEPEMKTLCMGVFSLLLICLFAAIFFQGVVKLFKHESIETTQVPSIRLNPNGTIDMFALVLDSFIPSQFSKLFKFKLHIYRKGNMIESSYLKPCQEQQWKGLGQNYKQQFQKQQLKNMFCPNTQSALLLNLTSKSVEADYIKVTIQFCDSSDINCQIQQAKQYLKEISKCCQAGKIWFYFLDSAISSNELQPVIPIVSLATKLYITYHSGGSIQIEFQSFQIKTDVSVMPLPFQEIKVYRGIELSDTHSHQVIFSNITNDMVLGTIRLYMNNKYREINRKVGKIDTLLSYAGGLFGLILSFLNFFLISYNQYCYELLLGEHLFKYKKQQEICRMHRFNFLFYIKYSIFDWIVFVTGQQCKWQDCRQIHKIRQAVVNKLIMYNLLNRLQKLEQILLLENQSPILHYLKNNKKTQDIVLLVEYKDELLKNCCKNGDKTIEQLKLKSIQEKQKQKQSKKLSYGKIQLESSSSIHQSVIQEGKILQILKKYLTQVQIKQISQRALKIQLGDQYKKTQDKFVVEFNKLKKCQLQELERKIQTIPLIVLLRLNYRQE